MRVVISGASGLVGSALTRDLRASGHTVLYLSRKSPSSDSQKSDGTILWDPNSASIDVEALEGADVIVHLSGASIAGRRWNSHYKDVLRSSRLDTTRVLVDSLARLRQKPRVFLCSSAVGYYGDRGDEVLTEESVCGTSFLALLARDWEAEAARAQTGAGIRTVMLRFGVILSSEGGALKQMVAPFRYGVGGRLGSGRQWMSWVALEDVIAAMRFAIDHENVNGPMNVSSPNPVRNVDFTKIVSEVLHRPAIFPAPPFALRLALGEMADALLLASERAVPGALQSEKFCFRWPDLAPTLQALLKK